MTNQDILGIALQQSAIDLNCKAEDFIKPENIIVCSAENDSARKYLELPFACNLVSYGHNIVASVRPELASIVKTYIDRFPIEHCFETPNLYALNDMLAKYQLKVCFMAEYFLPDVDQLRIRTCDYELRLLEQKDFVHLYRPEWQNALCEKRRQLDILGVGAYDHGELVGLAGCSADCTSMWQIGVDVLPAYRRQGIASSITSCLTSEILRRGKVPFYCAAWSNIKSVGNALRCGFQPAWVEMTVKSMAFIEELTQQTAKL